MPTCFGGTLGSAFLLYYDVLLTFSETTSSFLYQGIDGSEPVISLKEYHVIVCGLMGGSESSSPSNQASPHDGPNFPKTTYEDNIRLQKALTDSLGIKTIYAYIGFSMGGQQAYHAVTLFPDWVERAVMLATSAKTSAHNWSFLEGPKTALLSSKDFNDGHYTSPPLVGTRAFKRVYSTWALCQAWFREKQWETLGYKSLEDYLEENWGGKGNDANDLLQMTWTWQHGDITDYYPEDKGDLAKTLARIKARCIIMPARTDQYFPPEDSEFEIKHLKNAELAVIETIWGHVAGGGSGTKQYKIFIAEHVKKVLAEKT